MFCKTNWNDAKSAAARLKSGSCGLTDGSKAGQWRLPEKHELERRAKHKQGFNNVQSDYYWSSSTNAYFLGMSWGIDMSSGEVVVRAGKWDGYVWPVRDGK